MTRYLVSAALLACLAACSEAPTGPDAADSGAPLLSPDLVLESHGPPFYTIAANGGWIPNDGEWALFPFLRELDCVPPGANLLAIVGPPAFACAATVEGHEHWENGPGIDRAPRQTVFRGLGAVPIIFAALGEVQAAAADGTLTLPELLGLPSTIIGTAHSYTEVDILGVSGPLGPGRGMYKITARGSVDGGGSFRLHLNEVLGQQKVVQLRFD